MPTLRDTGSSRIRLPLPVDTGSAATPAAYADRIRVALANPPTNGNSVEDWLAHILTLVQSPTTRPAITRFDVIGDDSPPAGSIGGLRYRFHLSVAQTAHAFDVRIVGFPGRVTSPPSVAVLFDVQPSAAGDDTGVLVIPSNVSLAANAVYTLRLEVRETGQSLSDFPVAYQDYYITAHAPAASVHFGLRPLSDLSDRFSFGADDIEVSDSALGDWHVSGVPESGLHRFFWAVPTADPQPIGWSMNGFDIAEAVSDGVDMDIDGSDFTVYWWKRDAGFTDLMNNQTITTGGS